MSLETYMFECTCDHEGCEAILLKSCAADIEKAGWQIVKVGWDDRDYMDIGDEAYCPDHSVEGRGVFAILIPEPGIPRGKPIGEAAVALDRELP